MASAKGMNDFHSLSVDEVFIFSYVEETGMARNLLFFPNIFSPADFNQLDELKLYIFS